MKAILIDPVKREVSEVVYTGPYTQIYKLLSDPENGLEVDDFNVINLKEVDGNQNTLYVDGEGLLKDPHYFFEYRGYPQPLAGRGLVLGTDQGGDTIATNLTVDYIKNNVAFGNLSVKGFKTTTGKSDHPWLGKDIPYVSSTPIFGPPKEKK